MAVTVISWSSAVNTKAYGMETDGGDNFETVSFESGKQRLYLKNNTAKKIFTFSLAMDDTGASSEYKTFVEWWENTLLSGTLPFYFPDLITHSGNTEYQATKTYSVTGQKTKIVTLSVEEM